MPLQTTIDNKTQVWNVQKGYRVLGSGIMLFVSLLFPACFLFSAVYTKLVVHSNNWNPVYFWVFAGLFLLLLVPGIYFYGSIVGNTLVIGPGGLLYRSAGYVIRTPWSQILGYDAIKTGNTSVTGFIIDRKYQKVSGWLKTLYQTLPFIRVAAFFSGRYVPPGDLNFTRVVSFTTFENEWELGRLGTVVREYAPHLFNNFGVLIRGQVKSYLPEPDETELAPPDEEVLKQIKDPFFLKLLIGTVVVSILMLVVGLLIS